MGTPTRLACRSAWALLGLGLLLGCAPSTPPSAGVARSEPLSPGTPLPPLDPASWLNQPPEFDAGRWADQWSGQVLVVEAFATWCPECRSEAPRLVQLFQQLRDQGLAIVSLTAESGADIDHIRQFIATYDIPWPVGFGAQHTLEQLGVKALPVTFVVGRDGRVVWHSHMSDEGFRGIAQAIEHALQQGAS